MALGDHRPERLRGRGIPGPARLRRRRPRRLDPFVHMDQMGEVDYAPGEPKGTPWHPHRGFETVTYMIDGTFQHQDSNGGGGLITNGATQWMTAGAGILHIERPPEELVASGGLFHGIQLWVNLPASEKWVPPRYQDIDGRQRGAAHVTRRRSARARHRRRGRRAQRSRARPTRPISLAHVTVSAGCAAGSCRGRGRSTRWSTCSRARHRRRRAPAGPDGPAGGLRRGRLHHDRRRRRSQDGRTPNLELLVLGGRPIREPVAHYGPFVMNTHAEIAQALADYQAGRLGVVPPEALMPHVYSGVRTSREPAEN